MEWCDVSNKGFFFYELLIAIILILNIMLYLLIPINNLKMQTANQKYILEMKKTLIVNVILYEDDKELIIGDNYQLILNNQELCITFIDLFNKEQLICEKIWL